MSSPTISERLEFLGVSGFVILVTLVTVCLAYYIATAFWCLYYHPLAQFPGPKVWAVSRLPWARHVMIGDLYEALGQLHEKYGPVVRIAPDEITTIAPTAWKEIYASRPLLPKDPHSQTPPLNGAHSLFTAAGNTHKRIRGVLIYGFSDKALRDQAPIFENYASQLVDRLRKESQKHSDGVLDIAKLYGYTTFDVATDLSLGESYHGLQDLNEHSKTRDYFLHSKFGTIHNCLGRFYPLNKIFGVIFLAVTRKAREQNWRYCTAKIDDRLSKGDMTGLRSDFLTPAIGRVTDDGMKGITKKELTTNGLALVIANCQLTTVALSTATYLLLRKRQALMRLVQEVRQAFESESQITTTSTESLTYLEAVVNETLRIHHPTPISLPRMIPPEGQTVDGIFVPGKTIIGINLQNIQNSPQLWFEPEVFHPERFLPRSDPRYDSRFDSDIKEAFMPFSTGPRNCLGGRVFLAQARLILAKMIWNFELDLAEPNDADWLKKKAYLVFEPKSLRVNLVDRMASSEKTKNRPSSLCT